MNLGGNAPRDRRIKIKMQTVEGELNRPSGRVPAQVGARKVASASIDKMAKLYWQLVRVHLSPGQQISIPLSSKL
jgi:hypothetical protein